MSRLKSRFLVDLLLRRAEAAGGFATILARGDETSGIILVHCSERGQPGPLLERRFSATGHHIWEPVGPDGPRWLMLDEPVASLDLGHQLQVMRLARRYADAGGGVVAVMHDLNLSAMFADRIALLIDGRLEAIGPPAEVMQDHLLEQAYGCAVALNRVPTTGPWILPQSCGPILD